MKRSFTVISLVAMLMVSSVLPLAAVAAGPLTPVERGAMARAYVLKWGDYVQMVYKVPVGVWAKRMVPTFVHADADNFRNALKRTTYEGASAELSGVGRKLTDHQVIDTMARSKLVPSVTQPALIAQKLGAAASDLVYTPVTPCRILDTRTAGGVITGGASRDFNAVVGSGGNFSSQGGSATDCGVVGAGQAAVVINLTAVTPTGAGYATAYPFGTTRPLASSVNYAAGDIVNNSIVVMLPTPLTTKDFTVYTYATADYVADIVGYYAPPQATAFECVNTATVTGQVSNNGGVASVTIPDCPTGYARTTVYCSSGSANTVVLKAISPTACTVKNTLNNVSGTAAFSGYGYCCRVPGR
ncbi:MAG: hypothetical protein KA144_08230 [Xanthomonadaceae bacterium]|nr:hypothetical protein [Xanthomonadaceae bacterium]MCC7249157.1 hypothetical protein [Lysobacter sp.]